MANKLEFRLLNPDEIDVRVGMATEKGVSLLLYKDARVDMNILDETVGATNWQKSYQVIDGKLYCTISIWDEEKQQWISKQDVGTESNVEKEKGEASDAQKRAGFAWGIGRELYTSPFMWVKAGDCNVKDKKCYDHFIVKGINYDGRNIAGVIIYNQDTKATMTYGRINLANTRAERTETPQTAPAGVSEVQITALKQLSAKKGFSEKNVASLYKKVFFSELSQEEYSDAVQRLNKYADKEQTNE